MLRITVVNILRGIEDSTDVFYFDQTGKLGVNPNDGTQYKSMTNYTYYSKSGLVCRDYIIDGDSNLFEFKGSSTGFNILLKSSGKSIFNEQSSIWGL